MKLGEWIKEYRKEHGISMQVMADMCGFSKAYVGMLEKGINPTTKRPISPTMQTFQKIADAVGIDVNELIKVLDSDQPITVTPTSAPSQAPPKKGFTQADKDLLYAYHKAPEHIQQSVDVVLNPYKPGSSDAAADMKIVNKKEDKPEPPEASVQITSKPVKKVIPEYWNMQVYSEEDLMLLIEKAYSKDEANIVRERVKAALETLHFTLSFIDSGRVYDGIAALIKQNRALLFAPYYSYENIITHLKEVGILQKTQQQQVIQIGMG